MNIENTDYREEVLDLESPYDVKLLKDFLNPMGFDFNPNDVDYSIIIYNLNDDILGVGSSQGAVLKYVVVAEKYRETTVFALLVTHLVGRLIQQYDKIFAFTKPKNIPVFEGLGFRKIAIAKPLFSVLEYGLSGIKDYISFLEGEKNPKVKGIVGSVVVNCNPITKGHLYLIEKAACECDWVYLFIVEENLSIFPFEVRKKLVVEATNHISNLTIISGRDYIVSGKTFPSYFLKDNDIIDIVENQAELDVTIFKDYIVPSLGINRRYIGEEVYCDTTAAYNRAMHRLLTPAGVEVIEIARKSDKDGKCISASKIREAIRNNDIESVKDYLPQATIKYLESGASAPVKAKIQVTQGRH